jgi:hypothetical protein
MLHSKENILANTNIMVEDYISMKMQKILIHRSLITKGISKMKATGKEIKLVTIKLKRFQNIK